MSGKSLGGRDLPAKLGEWLKQLGQAIKRIAKSIDAVTYSITVGLTISVSVTLSP
jgi:hypothetical protein